MPIDYVLDIGSFNVRAGPTTEALPSLYTPVTKINLEKPVERGQVTNWKAMENTWAAVLKTLKYDAGSILIVGSFFTPKQDKEAFCEMAFERFQPARVCFVTAPPMCLFAASKTTGLVFESGDGAATAVPIVEGLVEPGISEKVKLGGSDVTNALEQLFAEADLPKKLARPCKEQILEITESEANGWLQSLGSPPEPAKYVAPDGSEIVIENERFILPEVLFSPGEYGNSSAKGLHQLIYSVVQNSAIDNRRLLYESVIMCGGNTLFKGFEKRLYAELRNVVPPRLKLNFIVSQNREHAAWIGGAMSAKLDTFLNFWVDRAEYDDSGAAIVHKNSMF